MKKIVVAVFVSPMGHDVIRTTNRVKQWADEAGVFEIRIVGNHPDSICRTDEYMLDPVKVAETDVFCMNCSDYPWRAPEVRKSLEDAISGGKGFLAMHGLQPGFQDWEAFERMCGIMWRYDASHGDFNWFRIHMNGDHPITQGLEDFDTKEELFCNQVDKWGVELNILATAYSDVNRLSRWGNRGTGRHEPVLSTGHYGEGRTINFLLGHVWPYYTGHGLGENTMISMKPPQVKKMLMRSFEWLATGNVEATI